MGRQIFPGEDTIRRMLGDELTDKVIEKIAERTKEEEGEKINDIPAGAVIFRVDLIATPEGLIITRGRSEDFLKRFKVEKEVEALLDKVAEVIEEEGDDLREKLGENDTFLHTMLATMMVEQLEGRK